MTTLRKVLLIASHIVALAAILAALSVLMRGSAPVWVAHLYMAIFTVSAIVDVRLSRLSPQSARLVYGGLAALWAIVIIRFCLGIEAVASGAA